MRPAAWNCLIQVFGLASFWLGQAGAASALDAAPRKLPEKCDDFEFHLTTTLLITISEDPCSLGKRFLDEFVGQVMEAYNDAQFETCDRFNRRVLDYEFIDICGDDGKRKLRELQEDYVNTGWPLPLDVDYGSSADTDFFTVNNRRRSLADHRAPKNEATTAMKAISHTEGSKHRNLPYSCCSEHAKGPSDGITARELEEIANDILLHLSNGEIFVTDLFEATTGCRTPLVDQVGEIVVRLTVPAEDLSREQVRQLEQDCILGYNNFVIWSCPSEYRQLQVCKFEPLSRGAGGRRLQDDGLSGLLGGGGDPGGGGYFEQTIRRQRSLESVEIQELPKDGVPRFLQQQDSQINTLPEDLCVCRLGAEDGRRPTVDQFAEILNETGLVESVIEVSPSSCRGPKIFRQVLRVIANGEFQSDEVSDLLGETIQSTINSLSIDHCVKYHFFVYSVELIWKEKKRGPGDCDNYWALMYRATYAAYDVPPHQYVPLFYEQTMPKSYGRSLESAAKMSNMPFESPNPDVEEAEVSNRRELWWIIQQSTCFCGVDTPESPYFVLSEVNDEINERICDGAVPGATFSVIT